MFLHPEGMFYFSQDSTFFGLSHSPGHGLMLASRRGTYLLERDLIYSIILDSGGCCHSSRMKLPYNLTPLSYPLRAPPVTGIGQARQASHLPTAENYTTASFANHRSRYRHATPPFNGRAVSTRPPPHHPRAQTIHDASTCTGPFSRAEGDIFYRGQAVTEEQRSTSFLSMSNYHLSPPVDHRQVDIAIPGMAGNAVRLQNIHSYYPIVGSNNSAQSSVTIPMTPSDTLWSSNAYPSTNTYYYPTQASTDFGAAGNPAMESDFPLSYSPPIQSPHSHTPPHGSRSQWQNPADSYRLPSNSDLRTELGQPWSHLASESQRGTSYGGRSSSSYLPVPPSLSHTSQSQWQNGANPCPLLVNPALRTELDQPSLHPASDSESQRGISHGGRPSYPLVPTSHTSHYSRSQWQNPTNSCSLS
ncbi:hypothetical protein M405DRAFT_930314, partial [Rhizopogon salebrosus TDB-379]